MNEEIKELCEGCGERKYTLECKNVVEGAGEERKMGIKCTLERENVVEGAGEARKEGIKCTLE